MLAQVLFAEQLARRQGHANVQLQFRPLPYFHNWGSIAARGSFDRKEASMLERGHLQLLYNTVDGWLLTVTFCGVSRGAAGYGRDDAE